MPHGGPQCGCSAALVLRIVGMSPKADDIELAIIGWLFASNDRRQRGDQRDGQQQEGRRQSGRRCAHSEARGCLIDGLSERDMTRMEVVRPVPA